MLMPRLLLSTDFDNASLDMGFQCVGKRHRQRDHEFSGGDAEAQGRWVGTLINGSRADQDGSLGRFLEPELTPPERTLARVEGWILGVP